MTKGNYYPFTRVERGSPGTRKGGAEDMTTQRMQEIERALALRFAAELEGHTFDGVTVSSRHHRLAAIAVEALAIYAAEREAEIRRDEREKAIREAANIADDFGSVDLNEDLHNEPPQVCLGMETASREIRKAILNLLDTPPAGQAVTTQRAREIAVEKLVQGAAKIADARCLTKIEPEDFEALRAALDAMRKLRACR